MKHELRRSADAGHEIGLHTHNHAHGSAFTSEEWSAIAASQELWEIPVYVLIVPPDAASERYSVPPGLRERLHEVRDYFDPADGKITGMDWNLWVEFGMSGPEVVAFFKYSLDQLLSGNRAPFPFGVDSDIYSEQYDTAPDTSAEERRQALRESLDYALSRPEVRVVTAKELVDWLGHPAPSRSKPIGEPNRSRDPP